MLSCFTAEVTPRHDSMDIKISNNAADHVTAGLIMGLSKAGKHRMDIQLAGFEITHSFSWNKSSDVLTYT